MRIRDFGKEPHMFRGKEYTLKDCWRLTGFSPIIDLYDSLKGKHE